MSPPTPEQARTLVERARRDPVWWIGEVLGYTLWDRQRRVVEAVRDNRDTAVASCHGIGKSFVSATIALWFLYTHPRSLVLTTAPTNRQVEGILWKEIAVAHSRARRPLGGRLLTQELELDKDWKAIGFTAPDYDPDRFQGWHAEHILVVVDESAGVSKAIFDGIAGVLTSQGSRMLMIGNPTDPAGEFAAAFKRPRVAKLQVSAFDTPNFTAFGITPADIASGAWEAKVTGALPAPHLVTPQWVRDAWERWGATSALYSAKVLGRFPEEGTDTLISLALVTAAMERELRPRPGDPSVLGVDVARFGDDKSTIYHRHGPVVRRRLRIAKLDTMALTGHVVQELAATKATVANVDVVGVGSGVVDRLRELGHNVAEVNAGLPAQDPERFVNARAEWFWALRERAVAGDLDLDQDEELAAQLSSIKYFVDSRGRIGIERKEDAKKRGLHSPDDADAVAYAFANLSTGLDLLRQMTRM